MMVSTVGAALMATMILQLDPVGALAAVAYRDLCPGGVLEGEPDARPESAVGNALISDSFESGDLSRQVNGFRWGGGRQTEVSTAAAHTGKYSLKFAFGPDYPGEDSFAEQRFAMPETSEAWVEYWILYPIGYQHRDDRPSNNKFFQFFNSGGGNMLTIETVPGTVERSNLRRFLSESEHQNGSRNWPSDTRGASDFIGPTGAIQPGEWTRIRIHYRSGLAGRAEIRVGDGWVHLLEWPFWRPDNEGRVDGGYLLGWSNSGFSEETDIYIDDFQLYHSDPSWK